MGVGGSSHYANFVTPCSFRLPICSSSRCVLACNQLTVSRLRQLRWARSNCFLFAALSTPVDQALSCIELLSSGDTRFLNRWLLRYAVEIQGVKKTCLSTSYNTRWVVCRTICLSLNPAAARFFDKNPFKELHGTWDKLP